MNNINSSNDSLRKSKYELCDIYNDTTLRVSDESWGALVRPSSIALVGASEKISGVSFTRRFLMAQENIGSESKVFFINPKRSEIFGQPCWKNVSSLPQPVDTVIINVPSRQVVPVVQEAVESGAKALLIHSGGFAERGPEGAAMQEELRKLCIDAGVAALGPNCLGIASFSKRGAVCSFHVPPDVPVGPLALISQSGAVASMLLNICRPYGVSFLASTGNEAVTTAEDLIARALIDPDVKVVVAFLEALRRPNEMFALAKRARIFGKTIIALKVGISDRGGEVSRGHTGAIAGRGDVFMQAAAQAGLVIVSDFDELIQTVALVCSPRKDLVGPRVGILGTSGGELAAAADVASALNVDLPDLAEGTVASIGQALSLPAEVGVRNPVDVGTGFASPTPYHDRMVASMQAMAQDESIDVIALLQGVHLESTDPALSLNREMLTAAATAASTFDKPIVVMSSRSGTEHPAVTEPARAAGIPVLQGLRESLRALGHLARLNANAAREAIGTSEPQSALEIDDTKIAGAWRNGLVPQVDVFALLEQFGIPVTSNVRLTGSTDLQRAFLQCGPKLVLKVDSPRFVHKSDQGGVVLDVTQANAERHLNALQAMLGGEVGEAVVAATQLQSGTEFYVGAKRDEHFGSVIVCGLGGRHVEILGKTSLLVSPFDMSDALDAISRSGALPFLQSYRGSQQAEVESLARTIVSVGQLAAALGDRLEVLDLNPVIINRDWPGGCVADARLVLRSKEG